MAQERKLAGFVKNLAQRFTSVSEVSLQLSTAKVKTSVPAVLTLKDLSRTVVDSVVEAATRSKAVTSQLVQEASKQLFRPTSVIGNVAVSRRPASLEELAPFLSRCKDDAIVSVKKDDGMPFDESMRESYMSQVILHPADHEGGELLPLRESVKETDDKVNERKKSPSVLLKDISPSTKIAKETVVRPPIISQASVDTRTRALVRSLRAAHSNSSKLSRTEDLTAHLLQFTDSKLEAVKRGAIPVLLNFAISGEPALKSQAELTLSLLGYSFPPNAPGPRILSIDGGGTRGLVALEMLRELESMTGKTPCDLFDYFIGVSTGAVVVTMLAVFKLSAEESLEFYKRTCATLFARDAFHGARRLILSHGYYDTAGWEKFLKKNMGEKMLVDLSRDARSLRLGVVSTKVDGSECNPFVFRSYGLPSGAVSHYEGSCKVKSWEAVRASTAAPGFFQDYRLDNVIYQDGGILNNNPTAIGIHECRLLWPKEKLHTVVSMGTGRFKRNQEVHNQEVAKAIGLTSWKSKLSSIIASATDTEGVHTTLQDLLPPSTYFRVNPILSEDLGMDISDAKKMDILIADSRKFIKENPVLMSQIADKLTTPRSSLRKANDWMKLQSDMTEFPQNAA